VLIIAIQIAIVVIISYFTMIRFAYRFPKHKDRLLDIFMIGLIVFIVPQFSGNTFPHLTELSITGLAIFGYGYILIIIYSFYQGYHGK